jgi:hypothetical protein
MNPRFTGVVVFLAASSALHAQRGPNPEFTFSVGGPCGETIYGVAGTAYDDGTGGTDLFLNSDLDENNDPTKSYGIPNNRPGHTWDIVLSTAMNPTAFGAETWRWGLGAEGAIHITDVTTSGTASCRIHPPRLPCRRWGGAEFTLLTGPPYGYGGEDNRGAVCFVVLSYDAGPFWLPPEGGEPVAKIRVTARFPEHEGEEVSGRLSFVPRRFWVEESTFNEAREVVYDPVVHWAGHWAVWPDERSNPPLRLEPCEVRFRAVSPLAPFIRCDTNDDGTLNIADPVWIFRELFRGGVETRCPAAADCNGDGGRDISDGIYALSFLFRGTPAPPAPFPACGRVADMDPRECPFPSTRCPP